MDSDDRVLREEMLRREVLAGNEQAWGIWYGETFDDLYRYVLWRCGGRRDWADESSRRPGFGPCGECGDSHPVKAVFWHGMRGFPRT